MTTNAAGYFDYFNGVGVNDGPAARAARATTAGTWATGTSSP
ncbi:hypothetical protein ACFQV2_05215 [Actinokineospora soli]|uniref:Uncharacterized protein n=1 Tax=Actinokineospora soli TaxID=1048753 RepID=A0ABW2THF1_9PSEU